MNQTFIRKLSTIHPYKLTPASRRCFSTTRTLDQEDGKVTTKHNIYTGPIVISGVSGRFPNASSMKELSEKLFNKEDLTSEATTRWQKYNQPKRIGFLNCLDKFDANFFGLTPRQAGQLDPQMRLLLEAAFEAVIDSGKINTSQCEEAERACSLVPTVEKVWIITY